MSFWSLRDHLIELFSILDNTPPFNNKEFAKCLTNKGIQHMALSLHYPQSNVFVDKYKPSKNMMMKSQTKSFQEILAVGDVF